MNRKTVISSHSTYQFRLIIILLAILSVVISACGGNGSDSSGSDNNGNLPATPITTDINGVWRLDRAYAATTTTPNTHVLCKATDDYVYLSISQDANKTLAVSAHTGDISAGKLSADNSFSLSGNKQWMDTDNLPNQISLTYTGTTASNSMNGTYKEVYSKNGNVVCDREMTFDGSLVYTPTGTEDYSGMYATESNLIDITNKVTLRDSSTVQLDINGADNISVYSIENASTTNPKFNPSTGIATFTLTWSPTNKDYNGDKIPDSANYREEHTLLLVRAPDDTSGLPVFVGSSIGSVEFTSGNATVIAPRALARTYYSRPVTSTTFTRTNLLPASGGNSRLFYTLGIANPPLKIYNNDNNSVVEVIDTANMNQSLCSSSFRSKYQHIVRLPFPDMNSEAFSAGIYSLVFCNIAASDPNRPQNAMPYVINIRDSKVPSNSDTFTVTAKILEPNTTPTVLPNRRAVNLNGALSSETRRNASIPVFGYYNPQQDLAISWDTTTNTNIDQYQLRFKLENDSTRDYRVIIKDPNGGIPLANSVLPMDTLLKYADYGKTKVNFKLVERINSNGIGLAQSRFLKFQPGLRGLININVSNPTQTDNKVFQLFVRDNSNQFNIISCLLTHAYSYKLDPTVNNCSDGDLDFNNNSLDLSVDIGQGLFPLNIVFNNANLGTATLNVNGENWVGQAKIVNPELRAFSNTTYDTVTQSFKKSTVLSYVNPFPYARSAQLVSRNASLPNEPYTTWDDTDNVSNSDYAQRYRSFRIATLGIDPPINTQTVMTHITSGFRAANYLANDRYTIVTYPDSPTPAQPQSARQRYAVDYTSPATVDFPVDPPIRSNFTVNGTAITNPPGATATFGSPYSVTSNGASGFTTLSWVYSFTGMDPNLIRWQIRSRRVVANINPPNQPIVVPHELIQTRRLAIDGVQLSYDPNTGIWTWQATTEFSLNVGEIRKINVRASTPNGLVRIQSQGLYITNP